MKLSAKAALPAVAVIAVLGAVTTFAGASASASGAKPVTVRHTITDTGAEFNTIAVDQVRHLAYVAEYNGTSGQTAVINTVTGKLKALTVPDGASSIAIDEKTDMVYIPDYFTGTIAVLHRTTVVKTITLSVNSEPTTAAIDPATGLVYISCNGEVTILKGSSVVGTVSLSGGVLYAPAVDPASGDVYIPTQDGDVAVLKAKHFVESISIGASASVAAVDPTRDLIYVSDPADGKVVVLKGTTVEHRVDVANYPGDIVVDPATHLAYVGQYMGDHVSILDGRKVERTAKVGSSPDEAVLDAGNGLVMFAGIGSGTITVFDGTRTLESVPTTQGGYQTAVATDSSNGRVFLSSATGNAITELQSPVPGTITIHRPTDRHYAQGAKVTVKFHCAPGAGNIVTSCVGTAKNGHQLSTSKLGIHHFTVALHQRYGLPVKTTITYRVIK